MNTQQHRLTDRIEQLYAHDRQFAAARPDPDVLAAARRPGLRLPQVVATMVRGYADRPALGRRARAVTTDPVTGLATAQLLPQFETVTYREVWAEVAAVAAAWRTDPRYPVTAGDFVAAVGFTSGQYLTVDLVCGYLGLVMVPLQHNAAASRLQPIIGEVEPRVLVAGAEYLDLAVECASAGTTVRRVVVIDHHPDLPAHRDNLERARARLRTAGVSVETLGADIARGRDLPPEPMYDGGSDERLAMLLYTSGSTGAPKGVMYTERMVAKLWSQATVATADTPVTPIFNVNYLPLNHIAGRLPLAVSFQAGGTSFFVPEPDLSTLFEDWSLTRPTQLGLVPRVVEMLFQRYQGDAQRLRSTGADPDTADAQAKAVLRQQVLGGRVLSSFCGSAPMSAETWAFIESCLQVPVLNAYGVTELGGSTTKDGIVARPPVIDYKLIDVPELGYFRTDKPHPRGELLVRAETASPGYYKRPDATAQAFDADGYYRTGDVMAEIGPDHLVYVDRRANVLKLAQGEFVAVSHLEAVFAAAPLIDQVFVYGNSERSNLLAVVVPTEAARRALAGDTAKLKSALADSLRRSAKDAELAPYELPSDFLIEPEPFTTDNGLLAAAGKLARPRLTEHYRQALEQLYTDQDLARADELNALRDTAADRPVLETLLRAVRAQLGASGTTLDPDARFLDLGGDSLAALTLARLLQDIFGVAVPVAAIISPATTLRRLAEYLAEQRGSTTSRPTFTSVHGRADGALHAADLTLDKFIDAAVLAATPAPAADAPATVLLTGANGFLGRFLCLDWLQRLAAPGGPAGGKLICIVRGSDDADARRRLHRSFDSGDPDLLNRFEELAAGRLEVIAGDIGEPNLGLAEPVWQRLTETVDLIVHAAALVNHVLPYEQLFGPNVVGTAEIIRLAITARIKPVSYLSTVVVAEGVPPDVFVEDGDTRRMSPTRALGDGYANGYANSKWAGEVLLREAHDRCGLPVTVFRCGMMLAHTRYAGQLNVPDVFTRLLLSLLLTGIAPRSFYRTGPGGERPRAHYDGLPVDFVAAAITELGATASGGFRGFDVANSHDDGVSLDVFVDWLIDAGHDIHRIDDYDDWIGRCETALRALPEEQRAHSLLPVLDAYRKPEPPLRGAAVPAAVFRAAVQHAEIGAGKDIPHLSAELIGKYAADLRLLGLR